MLYNLRATVAKTVSKIGDQFCTSTSAKRFERSNPHWDCSVKSSPPFLSSRGWAAMLGRKLSRTDIGLSDVNSRLLNGGHNGRKEISMKISTQAETRQGQKTIRNLSAN